MTLYLQDLCSTQTLLCKGWSRRVGLTWDAALKGLQRSRSFIYCTKCFNLPL